MDDGFTTQFRVVWCVTDGPPGPVDPINDDTCVDPVPATPLLPSDSTPSIVITAVGLLNALIINTDIDFGTVFPGQTVSDDFELCLADPSTSVAYDIDLLLKPLNPDPGDFPDMRPYMIVEHDDAGETDSDPDSADGRAGDYAASGSLDGPAGDTCDRWIVTLDVPHFVGEYNAVDEPVLAEQVEGEVVLVIPEVAWPVIYVRNLIGRLL